MYPPLAGYISPKRPCCTGGELRPFSAGFEGYAGASACIREMGLPDKAGMDSDGMIGAFIVCAEPGRWGVPGVALPQPGPRSARPGVEGIRRRPLARSSML
mmetsp:Transcript_64787/g.186380  ORF Transcript_64787/g.186380 Transcript_64787/m.186380 type:complete len:101 (+) Transcript_64787:444-746(+)